MNVSRDYNISLSRCTIREHDHPHPVILLDDLPENDYLR
jgi:hypothetical protein